MACLHMHGYTDLARPNLQALAKGWQPLQQQTRAVESTVSDTMASRRSQNFRMCWSAGTLGWANTKQQKRASIADPKYNCCTL